MSKEQLARLFTPFTTFNRNSHAIEKNGVSTDGIGLGLALSKILLSMSAGEIRVDSMHGQGSVFEVVIPAANSAEAPVPAHREFKAGVTQALSLDEKHSEAILLVDDDIDCVESLARNIERQGFRIIKATGVLEALGIINYECPRLIISDSSMPDGGLKRILTHIRTSGIFCSVAVLSGTVGTLEKEEYFAMGASAVFAKPADFEALTDWVSHEIWMLNQMQAKQRVA